MQTPSSDWLSDLDVTVDEFAVTVVNRLLAIAVARRASDVHLQPRKTGWDVMLRIDGVLNSFGTIPGGSASDPVTRLMVLAGMPTYRSEEPMEGRVRWTADTPALTPAAIRLGIYPTVHGCRAVIRLLHLDAGLDLIESLGLPVEVSASLRDLCHSTEGAILVTGPTGSGKTTSMYAMLRQIAAMRPRRSVLTIEDPVESVIDSISQSDLSSSGGMSLAAALRSAVRQDSEVLLVSEIRDPETAVAAFQASLTGHLVFSSLHASDVAAALRRLSSLGIPPYIIRSGIRAIISQRLVRRLCPNRKDTELADTNLVDTNLVDAKPPDAGFAAGSAVPGCRNDDCRYCGGLGYHGRQVVAELVRFDGSDPAGEAMLRATESVASLEGIRAAGREHGGHSLRGAAESLVRDGVTDAAELFRVLGPSQIGSADSESPAG